jgi:hypothetical protein
VPSGIGHGPFSASFCPARIYTEVAAQDLAQAVEKTHSREKTWRRRQARKKQ